MGNVEAYATKAVELLRSYGPKLLLAIIVLLIGLRTDCVKIDLLSS